MFAIAWGHAAVLLWASAIAALAVASALWSRSALDDVEVEFEFDPPRAFVGEEVALRVRIANGKRLPLPIVRLLVRFPPGLLPEADPDPTALKGHRRRLSIPGRSDVEVVLPVVVSTRGEYWLEGVDVVVSDPFDLAPVKLEVPIERALLVLPQPRSGIPLRIARRLPFGSPAPAVRLFEDREHFAGVRDYEPGDPMHHVHWRLSAHAGASDEAVRADAVGRGAVRPRRVERRAVLARRRPRHRQGGDDRVDLYLARQAIHAGWRTGLVANTHLRRGGGPLRVPSAQSVGAEAALFAALARMPNQPTNDLGPILREMGRRLVRRTNVIVVSPRPGPSLTHEMEGLRRRGCEVYHLSPLEAFRKAAS